MLLDGKPVATGKKKCSMEHSMFDIASSLSNTPICRVIGYENAKRIRVKQSNDAQWHRAVCALLLQSCESAVRQPSSGLPLLIEWHAFYQFCGTGRSVNVRSARGDVIPVCGETEPCQFATENKSDDEDCTGGVGLAMANGHRIGDSRMCGDHRKLGARHHSGVVTETDNR